MTLVADRVLRMSRRFDASPERLFDAWTDPARASRWLFTTPVSEAHSAELDVRVGGAWLITDRRDGVDYQALGEYLQVDRPRRLAFTFGMPQFSPEVARVTIEIETDGAGCLMTLTQEPVSPDAISPLEEGWRGMFDQLEAAVAA